MKPKILLITLNSCYPLFHGGAVAQYYFIDGLKDRVQFVLCTEVKTEKEVKEGSRVLRNERYFGSVSRSFTLGQEIEDSAVSAKYVDGVLELVLPKRTVAKSKRIAIE